MSEDKWWGKTQEKESSKETIEEMMDHTEMMRIKREEEMAQAQHEFNMSKMEQNPPPASPTVQANKGAFDWMTDDPGYLFLTIIVALGFIIMIIGAALTPSVDEEWGTTDGIVLEGTEWWEYEVEHEDCLYDEYYDEYYDCIYTYSYDCGADIYYNYSLNGVTYFDEYYDYFLGNWDDYCLEIVENETLPVNSSVEVWYKLDDEATSTLEEPNDTGQFLIFLAFCCLLPLILGLLFVMYFEGNNKQYHDSSGGAEIHHHYHGGGAIFGGSYYGSPWHRRPWFHRRRSRRITRSTSSRRISSSRRSSGGGSRRSSGGGSRRSGGGRRSR